MNNNITDLDDIAKLRYDIVRFYDLPEFNGALKAFVMNELDSMVSGETNSKTFLAMQHRIHNGILDDGKHLVSPFTD